MKKVIHTKLLFEIVFNLVDRTNKVVIQRMKKKNSGQLFSVLHFDQIKKSNK